ncbi:MAG: tetratricopeptide repeat protein [Bryobacteraceae bacterium]|jgi:predicted Zn-dependent protease
MRLATLAPLFAFCVAAHGGDKLAPGDPAAPKIDAAEKAIRTSPASEQPYLALAGALCRKARDSEDVRYYDRADAEIQHAIRLSPASFDARKLQVEVLLGRNQLDDALKLATELNKKIPDDLAVWALLARINVALGNYTEAVPQAQWVLDLRPGSTLGFVEAARLRAIFGDPEGAREFYEEGLRRTPLADLEERAWLLAQTARNAMDAGDLKGAAYRFEEAIKANPQSQVAMAGLAQLRLRQGEFADAIKLLDERRQSVDNTRNLYDLADALDRAGHKEQAAAAFHDFESRAAAEQTKSTNANLQLILYYADRGSKPAAALELATRESQLHHDFATLDALAWALYANGRYTDAKTRITEALSTGVRNPGYFCHASKISAMLNDAAGAKKFARESAALDPLACVVEKK